jgi:hypothetical protein
MDLMDFFTIAIIAVPVIVILSKITINDRMKKVYVEDRYNEVKRIRV